MAARALHWHRRGLIQRSRACWQQSRWSSKGKAREADALKPEKQEQSFRGRYCVEGALLPNADLEVPTDSASQSIDDRLSNRTETKMSSTLAAACTKGLIRPAFAAGGFCWAGNVCRDSKGQNCWGGQDVSGLQKPGSLGCLSVSVSPFATHWAGR
ncbi:unnamed protein product [Cladocopium goreaui]|uniref:Uncharacterized protein n=1 Tax=Cladocopium goreaui TaxID=2562237 RepID=A0A9P1FUA9_9DINO|nr:unnamed protein product [Cladocopium goreaui]